MSIKFWEIVDLKKHFLYNSSEYLKLTSEYESLLKEIKEILEKETFKGFTKKEIKILRKLNPSFFDTQSIRLGKEFPFYICVNFPINSTIDSLDLGKIKSLEDRVIENRIKIKELKDNFDRFINKNTSLVWLKKELPEVYKKLKNGI